jgi:hypothetical protein
MGEREAAVLLDPGTWAVVLGLTCLMIWLLGPSSRSTNDLFADLLRGGFSTAVGLAGAAMWWRFRRAP